MAFRQFKYEAVVNVFDEGKLRQHFLDNAEAWGLSSEDADRPHHETAFGTPPVPL